MHHYRAGSDNRIMPNSHTWPYRYTAANTGVILDYGRLESDVLKYNRVSVIGEHYAVSDKNIVANVDMLTNKRVRFYLAHITDDHAALNFDKRAHTAVSANLAAVNVTQVRVKYLSAFTDFNVFNHALTPIPISPALALFLCR